MTGRARKPLVGVLLTLAALAAALPARAEEVREGVAPGEVDRFQLLRRLSLDLRGRVPSISEYEALASEKGLPAQVVRSFVADEGFRLRMRRFHASFLWPNLENVILGSGFTLLYPSGTGPLAVVDPTRALISRGAILPCGDFEQTEFDPAYPGEYRPLVDWTAVPRQEGWRWVEPYWAPGTRVKVCAFDAQETEEVVVFGRAVSCTSAEGLFTPGCGCGPHLRGCFTLEVDRTLRSSLLEQLLRAVDAVSTGQRSYTELLLGRGAWENGAIAFFKRHLAPLFSPFGSFVMPDPEDPLAERGFDDAQWEERDRQGLHSGILTLPSYLLRFPTDRARANRFFNAFACESFTAPSDPVPQAGCSASGGDLTQRCFCQGCHATLEPLAHHWALFAESGTTQMTDPEVFPRVRPECVGSGDPSCLRFYVTSPESPAAGHHLPYQYSAEHPEYLEAIEQGPRAAAGRFIADGTLARCTVRRLFAFFMKREMRLDGEDADEGDLLGSLAGSFVDSNYDLPSLVEAIVSLPEYRRVR